jgi:prepilin-type N-terminal cleavage/methylation domain-containing protein/prepilin-type processing-associated H-X9-DG protein
MQSLHHARAFTLIELLVVISIVALLIAILLPALSRARESAQKITCLSQTRQITLGNIFYAEDHDGWFPIVHDNTATNYRQWRRDGVGDYFSDRRIMRCPGQRDPRVNSKNIAEIGAPDPANVSTTYRIFAARGSNTSTTASWWYGWRVGLTRLWDVSRFANDSHGTPIPNIQFAENPNSLSDSSTHAPWEQPTVLDLASLAFGIHTNAATHTISGDGQGYPDNHADGANIAYLDGHAAFLKTEAQTRRSRMTDGWVGW